MGRQVRDDGVAVDEGHLDASLGQRVSDISRARSSATFKRGLYGVKAANPEHNFDTRGSERRDRFGEVLKEVG